MISASTIGQPKNSANTTCSRRTCPRSDEGYSVTLVVKQAGDKEAARSARSDLHGREHAPEWLTQVRAMDRNQGDAV